MQNKINLKAFTHAEVLIAKRERGKMSLLNLSRTRELKEPSSRFMKQCAFTLAEVLITLGIIGVVAALTIPVLMNNIEKKDNFSKLQKAISVIASAGTSIRGENGGNISGLATNSLELANLFKPYLSTIKFCQNLAESPNCYIPNSGDVYSLDGQYFSGITPSPYNGLPKIVTADGFMYWFETTSSDCSGIHYIRNSVNENCGNATVDINGTKPPNTYGKDIFVILINKYNVTPRIGSSGCNMASPGIWNGVSCSGKAVQEGGIKYY